VSLTLRTSRSLRGGDRAQLYFTNPVHLYHRPPNFVAVSFFHAGATAAAPGYLRADLVAMFRSLAAFGDPVSGWFERYDVAHDARVQQVRSRLAAAGLESLMPYWLTVLPRAVAERALAFGLAEHVKVQALARLTARSTLIQVGDWPLETVDDHAMNLCAVAGAIEEHLARGPGRLQGQRR
jgi:hypothetical protein